MKISLIVAASANNVIGKDNRLPWRMPADMKFFKEKTTGHFVITGRKNYDSIPEKFRPLPDRTNIVVTRNTTYLAPGATVVHALEQGIEIASKAGEKECFIIGGADIYRQAISLADKIYFTRINTSIDGDAFFPEIPMEKWQETGRLDCAADEKNPFSYSFLEFEKKK